MLQSMVFAKQAMATRYTIRIFILVSGSVIMSFAVN